MAIDMALAKRLKTYRNFKHLTQKDVATYLNVPHSAISDIENGKRDVTVGELKILSSLYGRSVEEIKWLQGLISMYNVDLRLKEEAGLAQGMAAYYAMLKEAMERGKVVEMINMRRNRVIERFESREALIEYIEELEKKRLMTTSRKKALLRYLGKGEDA